MFIFTNLKLFHILLSFLIIAPCNKPINQIQLEFKDKNPIIRNNAVNAFFEIDRTIALDNIKFLLELSKDNDLSVRGNVIRKVGLLFLVPPVESGIYWFNEDNPRRITIDQKYIDASRIAIPLLIEALDDSSVQIRIFAARSLGLIGPPSKISVPSILRHLLYKDFYFRQALINALANIGPEAKEAIPYLKKIILDQNEDDAIKRCAIRAISIIEGR